MLAPVRPIRKMPKSSNLSLNRTALAGNETNISAGSLSPPLSPPFQPSTTPNGMNGNGAKEGQHSPITALPQQATPHSPKERARSIFSTKAFSKSQSRLAQETTPLQPMPMYQQTRSPGSTPDLTGPDQSSTSDCKQARHVRCEDCADAVSPATSPRAEVAPLPSSVKSTSEPHLIPEDSKQKRGDRKQRFGQKLIRTKSIGRREQSPATRGPVTENDRQNPMPADSAGLRTAPLEMKAQDKRFREMMGGKPRNRSADRAAAEPHRTPSKERKELNPHSSLSRDSQSSGHFFQNIRNSKSRASDLGRGFFGKITRSSSSHDREELQHPTNQPNPDTYVPTIIRMSLVDQTRATRISKRLESSRDKTEFWLPALPWRCIEYVPMMLLPGYRADLCSYLNLNGLEVEGLYRVSGSLKEIKRWQMRFDLEKDVNLMDAKDLYDVNLVASLLKDWLRNLPEQILPDNIQKEIMKIAPPGTERCPTEFSQALSQLPPFNYYLLFAITCHLSLLTSCYEKTKMDFDNLCVCIQPSLGIDRVLFRILIKDWRNCWQGCYTEKAYLEQENAFLAGQKANQVLGNTTSAAQSSTNVAASGAGASTTTAATATTSNDTASIAAASSPTDDSRTDKSLGSPSIASSMASHSGRSSPDETDDERDTRRDTIKAVPPSARPSEEPSGSSRGVSPVAVSASGRGEATQMAPMLSPHKPLEPIGSLHD